MIDKILIKLNEQKYLGDIKFKCVKFAYNNIGQIGLYKNDETSIGRESILFVVMIDDTIRYIDFLLEDDFSDKWHYCTTRKYDNSK
jgi:hypothetical protein